jgi:hypothetical protein
MNSEIKIDDYIKIIKTATFEKLVPSPGYRFSPGESQIGLTVAPPSNCDIRFRVGKFMLQMPKFQLSEEEKQLPESWKNYTNDAVNSKDKRLLLSTRPVNQGHCGSCFAVAIATTISDNFLFKYNLDYNPNLSPLYILSCLDNNKQVNNQCGGGNPSLVVDLIMNNGGISTNCAQNYYKLCEAQEFCQGDGKDHMIAAADITLDDRNKFIPPCGRCTDDKPKLFTIKKKIVSFDVPSIKLHIMKYGAAVGGFLIFKNFMSDVSKGKFLKTNGIYIHSVDYSNNLRDFNNILGGHAISIVGWGSDTITFNDIYGNQYKNRKINYWICRNSWSTNWGDGGYFKYAMYQEFEVLEGEQQLPPIQGSVAFEKDNGAGLGGVILIEPDRYNIDPEEGNPILNKVTCDTEYKCETPPSPIPTPLSDKKETNQLSTFKKFMFGFFFIIVMICLYFYIFGTGKKRKGKGKKQSHRRSRSRR